MSTRKNFNIKELPQVDENHHLLDDSFVPKLNTHKTDDPFDQVRQLPNYMKVKTVTDTCNISSSEASMSTSNVLNNMSLSSQTRHSHLSENSGVLQSSHEQECFKSMNVNKVDSCSTCISPKKSPQESNASNLDGSSAAVFSDCSPIGKTFAVSTPLNAPTYVDLNHFNRSLEKIKNWSVLQPDFETFSPSLPTTPKSAKLTQEANLCLTVTTLCSCKNNSYLPKDKKFQMKPQVIPGDFMNTLGIEKMFDCASINNFRGFTCEEQNKYYDNVNSFSSSMRYFKIRNCHSTGPMFKSQRKKRTKKTITVDEIIVKETPLVEKSVSCDSLGVILNQSSASEYVFDSSFWSKSNDSNLLTSCAMKEGTRIRNGTHFKSLTSENLKENFEPIVFLEDIKKSLNFEGVCEDKNHKLVTERNKFVNKNSGSIVNITNVMCNKSTLESNEISSSKLGSTYDDCSSQMKSADLSDWSVFTSNSTDDDNEHSNISKNMKEIYNNSSVITIADSTSNEVIVILSSSSEGEDEEEKQEKNLIKEETDLFDDTTFCNKKNANILKPGKSWRRSLVTLQNKNHQHVSLSDKVCCATSCFECQANRRASKIVLKTPLQRVKDLSRLSYLEQYAIILQENSSPINQRSSTVHFTDQSFVETDFIYKESTPLRQRRTSLIVHDSPAEQQQQQQEAQSSPEITARELVLRRCEQLEPLPFCECYPSKVLELWRKIGEGVFGEVFLDDSEDVVMKVIPIEGDQMVNGERQKRFNEIVTEIVIAGELSSLRNGTVNSTNGFSEVKKIRCVQGSYPLQLLEHWETWNEINGSENDSPAMFGKDQLYIVLELANCGQDMEAFVFNNAQQAYSLFKQTACALAVAECALQFEHRDLHWGNVLITSVPKHETFGYTINGVNFKIPSHGVKINIIDFTLSRITCDNVCIYNDLAPDKDLFTADGDYQFEIYRLMQNHNKNEWHSFQPYTNILWLHYLLDKSIRDLRYKHTKSKLHRHYIAQLELMKAYVKTYESATKLVEDENIFNSS